MDHAVRRPGSRFALYVLSAVLVLWLTLGDEVLHALGLPWPPCVGGPSTALLYHELTSFPAFIWWALIQFARWKSNMYIRWQTYLGWLIVILGTFPTCRMVSAADRLVASGVGDNWTLWLAHIVLIGLVLAGKVTIWVYWWKVIHVWGERRGQNNPPTQHAL